MYRHRFFGNLYIGKNYRFHLRVVMPGPIGEMKITHEKRAFSVDSFGATLMPHVFLVDKAHGL